MFGKTDAQNTSHCTLVLSNLVRPQAQMKAGSPPLSVFMPVRAWLPPNPHARRWILFRIFFYVAAPFHPPMPASSRTLAGVPTRTTFVLRKGN